MADGAYKRFIDSMVMDFDKWHDGIGFDLSALKEMSPDDLKTIVTVLLGRDQTWREIEALAAIGDERARQSVRKSADDPESPDNRLVAMEELHRAGEMPDIEQRLCREIRKLAGDGAGLTKALLMAQRYPTDQVKQALLWSTWNSTTASLHCAATLLYLCGVAKDQLGFEHRPLLFDLTPNNNHFTRQAAFDK
ncbi:MAG: hypothetical protein H7144_05470, partial [Burkholderiales bacterium]|nr:hypothetical protein [Phycisphaerae bacterium]